jgi:hypothetical protein
MYLLGEDGFPSGIFGHTKPEAERLTLEEILSRDPESKDIFT